MKQYKHINSVWYSDTNCWILNYIEHSLKRLSSFERKSIVIGNADFISWVGIYEFDIVITNAHAFYNDIDLVVTNNLFYEDLSTHIYDNNSILKHIASLRKKLLLLDQLKDKPDQLFAADFIDELT